MAQNRKYNKFNTFNLVAPSGVVAGDPFASGMIAGVALTDRDSTTTKAVAQISQAVFTLSVKGVDGSGNSAVAVGDALYCVNGDTPRVSKKATGAPIGYALAAVTSGSTASIDVLMK